MKFNRLDRNITIESYSTADNEYGEQNRTWSTFHTCFAELQKAGGGESSIEGRETATKRVNFLIRYFPGITERMRVKYEEFGTDRYFDIVAVNEIDRRQGLQLQTLAKQ